MLREQTPDFKNKHYLNSIALKIKQKMYYNIDLCYSPAQSIFPHIQTVVLLLLCMNILRTALFDLQLFKRTATVYRVMHSTFVWARFCFLKILNYSRALRWARIKTKVLHKNKWISLLSMACRLKWHFLMKFVEICFFCIFLQQVKV